MYFDETVPDDNVTVPDFALMHRQQASDAAGQLGLYILVTGNDEISPHVTVISQDIPAGTSVPRGTTVTLHFADTKAAD